MEEPVIEVEKKDTRTFGAILLHNIRRVHKNSSLNVACSECDLHLEGGSESNSPKQIKNPPFINFMVENVDSPSKSQESGSSVDYSYNFNDSEEEESPVVVPVE